MLATEQQVGAVYGLAYDARRKQLYAAAYHKRGVPFGPGGPGAIYQIDPATGQVKHWAALSAGPDRHQRPLGMDELAAPWVGVTGLADIDIDETATTLFVMNLYDRPIYRLSLPDGHLLGSFPVTSPPEAQLGVTRPFGLAYRNGWLFHGVMVSGGRHPTWFRGSLFASRGDGSDFRQVASFELPISHSSLWANTAIPMLTDIEFGLAGRLVGRAGRHLSA